MTRVCTVVGARPQFIKAAPVSRLLRSTPGLSETMIHTGQHYDPDMSNLFFRELGLPAPDRRLGVGSASQAVQTARMLEGLEPALRETDPDWVLVYGDTSSTLAGALAAAKLHLPVAHVEAGLRSFNRRMPEKVNRVLVDHCSDLLLAPTAPAAAQLRREGIPGERIAMVGDVMYDAALAFGEKAKAESRILETLALAPRSYVLATVHRAENTDDPALLGGILEGLGRIAAGIPVLLPLHPRTRSRLSTHGLRADAIPGLRLLPPVGLLDMIQLERNARAIATDSRGIQKEAFFYGVPCVTLRGVKVA